MLAAAVIGAFSWTTIEEAHWLTHGFWHCSLVFSVLGILLSASEITALHLLGTIDRNCKPQESERIARKYFPLLLSPTNDANQSYVVRKKMVFTWQSPLMFMSYSVCTFLSGLTLLVCTPLIRHGSHWTTGHNVSDFTLFRITKADTSKIAVMYLTVFAGAGVAFIFCSFWVYHYVELDFDLLSGDGQQRTPSRQSELPALGDIIFPFSDRNPSTGVTGP